MRHAAALALLLVGLAAAAARGAAGPSQGWLVYGNDPGRGGESADRVPATALRALWTRRLGGQITAQPLVARDVPSPGRSTVIVGTSLGTVHALDGGGRPLWHVRYGRASSTCHQLPGYGITGTPAIDADGSTVYVADAFGRLHALDLRTGRERAGWPVSSTRIPSASCVWGKRSRSSAARSTSRPARSAIARWRARCSASRWTARSARRGSRCRFTRRRRRHLGLGRGVLRRHPRHAARRHGQRLPRRLQHRRCVQRVGRLRRAGRGARPRARGPGGKPSAGDPGSARPRLRRLAHRDHQPLRRAGRRRQQERQGLRLARGGASGRADLVVPPARTRDAAAARAARLRPHDALPSSSRATRA